MFSSSVLMAADWTDRTTIFGFYSSRYSMTDEKTYFHGDRDADINNEGSFQGTKIGHTVTSQVNEDLTVAMLSMSADGHEQFYANVVKKSGKKLKAYCAKIVFSGKRTPPKPFASDADVIGWVAKTPGALGYVDSGAADDSVKVLLIAK